MAVCSPVHGGRLLWPWTTQVEGATVPIRYAPHEFDGWRSRHWTLPFEGERFSLVWFSPAEEAGGDLGDRYALPMH